MKNHYLLIDFENLRPDAGQVHFLKDRPFKVTVFVGAGQKSMPTELAAALQALGERGKYVVINGNGRNALDFHIAFYLGELAMKDPEASFYVVSKDTGFEPLLAHARARNVDARRLETLAQILPVDEDKMLAVMNRLESMLLNRPKTRKTLASTIGAVFNGAADAAQIERVITELERRGYIAVNGSRLVYSLPSD